MGMGLHEWPLMFFTVIGQSVAGAFIIMGCAILSGKLPEALNRKVHYSMFGLWLLMGNLGDRCILIMRMSYLVIQP